MIVVALIIVAYLAVALVAMRWLYGRWRAIDIDRYPNLDADWWDNNDAGYVMLGAAVTALLWPISLPIIAVSLLLGAWMGTTPVKSQTEHRAERDALQSRIGKLERELEIGGTP